MYKAVIIKEHGNSSVLQVKKVNLRNVLDNEVLIKHDFIGLNYYDVRQRSGLINNSKLPLIIGCEGVGRVEEISPNEKNFKIGDKVCYINAPSGAYSEKRIISTKYLIPIVDDIQLDLIAGSLHKILTAHFLMFRAFCVKKQMVVLVHDVCGNVGRFIVQLCNVLGCKVIGTVKSDEYNSIASDFGCDLVLNYNDPDMHKKVLEYTNGSGVAVVYDSIGKKSISLRSLAMLGLYVVYEQSSVVIQSVSCKNLNSRSLFFTAPSFFHYHNDPIRKIIDVKEIFELIKKKKIKCSIGKKYTLDDVKQAHDDLENNVVFVGSSVIIV